MAIITGVVSWTVLCPSLDTSTVKIKKDVGTERERPHSEMRVIATYQFSTLIFLQ